MSLDLTIVSSGVPEYRCRAIIRRMQTTSSVVNHERYALHSSDRTARYWACSQMDRRALREQHILGSAVRPSHECSHGPRDPHEMTFSQSWTDSLMARSDGRAR